MMDDMFLVLANYLAPLLIGYLGAVSFGPNRGLLIGAAVTVIAVFALLMLQVTPADTGAGSGLSGRMALAWGLMQFSAINWIAAFLVGGAAGAVHYRLRRGDKR